MRRLELNRVWSAQCSGQGRTSQPASQPRSPRAADAGAQRRGPLTLGETRPCLRFGAGVGDTCTVEGEGMTSPNSSHVAPRTLKEKNHQGNLTSRDTSHQGLSAVTTRPCQLLKTCKGPSELRLKCHGNVHLLQVLSLNTIPIHSGHKGKRSQTHVEHCLLTCVLGFQSAFEVLNL